MTEQDGKEAEAIADARIARALYLLAHEFTMDADHAAARCAGLTAAALESEPAARALRAMREQEDMGASYRWSLNAGLNACSTSATECAASDSGNHSTEWQDGGACRDCRSDPATDGAAVTAPLTRADVREEIAKAFEIHSSECWKFGNRVKPEFCGTYAIMSAIATNTQRAVAARLTAAEPAGEEQPAPDPLPPLEGPDRPCLTWQDSAEHGSEWERIARAERAAREADIARLEREREQIRNDARIDAEYWRDRAVEIERERISLAKQRDAALRALGVKP